MISRGDRPMIELYNLHRFFGRTRAVDNISFTVREGHVFGYIGPNGAGKTTSMRILATLDHPTYGDAYVDGFSVIDDPDHVRRRLGFMPDYFGAYANVNVYEYLDFFARSYGLRGKERIEALKQTMSFTKLDGLAEKPTTSLSKGMKQRLCLGRAMIHDPSVLVLDEPAAGLDPRARIQLREMIRELADRGKTILISSHILTELAEMCDTVGIIEQGQLLAMGSVDEIRGEAAEHTNMEIRVLNGVPQLLAWLEKRDGVTQISHDELTVRFDFQGSESGQATLLKELIQAEFLITAFSAKERSLEDVFMTITEGKVQ